MASGVGIVVLCHLLSSHAVVAFFVLSHVVMLLLSVVVVFVSRCS